MGKTLSVENFKGVREITLSPEGSLVVIAGGNGAGKSSFIDAFVELFDPKGTRLTPKPIRDGEDEARAEYIDTDLDIRIVRTWKKNDAGKLEVFALDGAKYSKPAEIVASLTGGLIFDPVQFLNLDEKKQRDALLAKVDLPFDIDELTRERAGAESRRLDAGRDVRRLQGALDSMAKPVADVPAEEVSAADLLAEIEKVQGHNQRIDRAEELVTELGMQVSEVDRRIEQLEAAIVQARADRAVWVERIAVAEHTAAVPRGDLASLQAKLAAVDETNAAVRAAKERHRVQDALAEAVTEQEDAQSDLDAIDVRKREALAAATFPVDGLSVDETGVTFQGIPFGQVNTAMRRKVAFAIATAGEPKLRLVIVKDGDLLDAESLEGIRDLAARRGYTVLVERDRDESREIGFTIIDGALAGGAA